MKNILTTIVLSIKLSTHSFVIAFVTGYGTTVISAGDDIYHDCYDEVEFSEVRYHEYPSLGLQRRVCAYTKDNDKQGNI